MKEKLLRVRENYMFSRTVYTQRVHTLYPRVFPEVQRSISAILFFFFLNETHCVLTSKVFTDIEFLTRTLILNFQLDTFNQFQGKIYLLQQYFSNLKISLDKVFFFFSMENIKILSTILCQLIFNIVIAARTSWRSWLARTTD